MSDVPPTTIPRDRKHPGTRPRVTGEDMLLMSRLHKQGRKITEIARLISTPEKVISPETVGQWLRRARQPQEDLHMLVAEGRVEALESWRLAMKRGARDGRHAPAKDWLIAAGTVSAQPTDRLIVVIGTGQADTASLPTLPARPLPAPPDAT